MLQAKWNSFSENSDKMQIEKYHHLSLIFKQRCFAKVIFRTCDTSEDKATMSSFGKSRLLMKSVIILHKQISLLCCLLFSERAEVAGFCLCKVAPGPCLLGCPVNSVVCPAVSLGGTRSASRGCQHLAPDGLTCGRKRGTCWKRTGGL